MSEGKRFLTQKKLIPVYFCFILTLILYGSIYIMAMVPPESFFGLDIPEAFVSHFVYFIPGPMWSDILLLYLFPIITFFCLKYISPYSTYFYLKLHRFFYTFRTKPKYGIYREKSKRITAGKILMRILKLSFLAFSLTGFLIPQFAEYFRYNYLHMIETDPGSIGLFNSEALFLGTFALSSLIMIIFFPIWFLEDSALMAYRKFKSKRMNPDIEGVNRIFRDFLEYFIGFSTILIYIGRIFNVISQETNGFNEFNVTLLIPIILIFLPFLLGGLIAVPMIFYEFKFNNNIKRIHKYLKKYDFNFINLPDFKDLVIRE